MDLKFNYIIIPDREFPSMGFLPDGSAFRSFRKDGDVHPSSLGQNPPSLASTGLLGLGAFSGAFSP